jgi:hypothetical protein
MKIPAKFNSDKSSAYLIATLHANGRILELPLLIDTGSSITTISNSDARLLGIKASELRRRSKPSITYAGRIRPSKLRGIDFIMREVEGNFVLEQLDTVDILPSTGDKRLDDALPSAIGMDFLNECSHSLYVCPKDNEAFLEKC